MKSYQELKVWQKSFKLSLDIYQITKKFPKNEIYGITSQLRRASITIPSNIAEGYCRQHRKEFIQFLTVAFSSGAELETQLLIAKEIGILERNDLETTCSLLTEVMKMLNALIRKLKI